MAFRQGVDGGDFLQRDLAIGGRIDLDQRQARVAVQPQAVREDVDSQHLSFGRGEFDPVDIAGRIKLADVLARRVHQLGRRGVVVRRFLLDYHGGLSDADANGIGIFQAIIHRVDQGGLGRHQAG